MHVVMHIKTLGLVVVLIMAALSGAFAAERGVSSIDLSSNPSVISADGKSITTITAQVRDREGKPAPDDTEIRFNASLGVIEETGGVQAGTARVKLVSASVPGTCVVTATWLEGQAVARTNVEFGDVSAPKGPDYIEVQAEDYLAYSVDHKTLEAIGGVKLKYRSMELEAKSVQIDLEKSRIVAKGGSLTEPVKLHSKSGVVEASMFSCDIYTSEGLLLSAALGGVRGVKISSATWEVGTAPQFYEPTEFDFADLSDSGILVKAKRVIIFPNEKMQFWGANVYVDGKRVLSLPLYVMSLSGYPVEGEQYVGYSTGGITLNLPFYYALSPNSSGALLVRHGDPTGWGEFGQKPGWFVDMRQKYATDKSEGMLALSQITGGNWGAQFTHSQQFGEGANGYLYLDYPDHSALSGSLNLSKSFTNLSVGLNLYGSSYPTSGQKSVSGDLHLQTRSKPIGKSSLSYNLRARMSHSYDYAADLGSTSERLDANLYTAPLRLGRDIAIRCTGGVGYVFGDSSMSGFSSLGAAVMDWKISSQNRLQLSYQFASRPFIYTSRRTSAQSETPESVQIRSRTWTQSLSASLRLGDGKKWSASVYAIKGLGYPSTTLFADLSYRLSRDWRFSARSTMNRFGSVSYNDLELGFGKTFGSRELLAVWSQSENRVMFELGSSGF